MHRPHFTPKLSHQKLRTKNQKLMPSPMPSAPPPNSKFNVQGLLPTAYFRQQPTFCTRPKTSPIGFNNQAGRLCTNGERPKHCSNSPAEPNKIDAGLTLSIPCKSRIPK